MATFEAQVSGLTSLTIDDSSSPTRAELNQFLTDGAKEIINQLPPDLLGLCSEEQTFTSVAPGSEAETMNTGKVLSVFRNDGDIDQPCRKISPTKKGRVLDLDDMSYASITDPIYYTENNKINSLPSGGSCKYSEVQYPTVSYTHDAISVFPDEAEYLVPLYASVRSLQNVLGSKSSNSDITTALTAVNTELDETQVVCDLVNTQVDSSVTALTNMATEIALANAEVDDAVTEIIEAITLTDSSSSDIKTAVDGMKTAVAKFRADGSDPALFGDESTYTTASSAMTNVKTYVDRAVSYINGNFPNAAYDLAANLADVDAELTSEDIELASGRVQQAQATLSAMDADLKIAQMYITEWSTMVQTLTSEVNAFSSEANARYGWIKAKADVWNGELASAQGYMSTANGYASQASGFNASAQGYATEVQTKINIAKGYIAEIQSRLSVDNAQYGWYEKQQAKLQADYDRGVQRLTGASA